MKRLITFLLTIILMLLSIITCFAEYENTYINTGDHCADFTSVALTQIGYTTEDKSKYSDSENWNSAFIAWCAREASFPETVIPNTETAAELFDFFDTAGNLNEQADYSPVAGDIIFFSDGAQVDSCAIVISCDSEYITAVIGDENNSVQKKLYSVSLSKIYAYATPDFDFVSKYAMGSYTVSASTLNLRAEPTTESEVITKLSTGTVIEITSFKDDWGYATYKDYAGWVSMDYVSYYDGDYHDISNYSVEWKAIDVSKWQSDIDWEKVAAEGIQAVIMRIGLRGSVTREILIDDKFLEYYEGAKEQGLHIGCYFYSTATTEAEAVEEAEFVIKTIEDNDIELDMPAYIDMEDKVTENCGKTVIYSVAKAYLERMDEANIYSGVYSSTSWINSYFDQALFNTHALWVADWTGKCGYTGEYGMWQYSETGRINGISSKYTDLNICYVDYPQLIADYGYNIIVKANSKANLGDVDADKKITASDARITLRIAAGLYTPTAEESLAADIDSNKKISASDARIILRIAAKLDSIENYIPVDEPESEIESSTEMQTQPEETSAYTEKNSEPESAMG